MARYRFSNLCLAGCSALALLTGGTARAQEAETGDSEEIIVTAQKRSENILEVPASVSAISGDRLADMKLESLADYAAYVPGLNVTGGGTPGQVAVTLRGIAPVGPGAVVGNYIDDTPVGSSNNWARATVFALDMMPYDLERLEVLKGPQGTLYGAGSMGGLLKYVLRAADVNDLEFQAGGDISSVRHAGDPGWSLRAAANVPIIQDKLGIRASVYDSHSPGFVDNAYRNETDINDVHQYGGRVALLWNLTDNFTAKFNAMWQRTKSDDNGSITYGNLTSPAPDSGLPNFLGGEPVFGELGQSTPLRQPFRRALDYYSLTLDWQLGEHSIISATSYSKSRIRSLQDTTLVYGALYPFVPPFGSIPAGLNLFDMQLDLEKWTQEVRIVSPTGGTIEWIVGAYYTDEDSRNPNTLYAFDLDYQPIPVFQPYFAIAHLFSTYEEIAAFGDITVKLSDRFDVTLGGRFAHNEQAFTQVSGSPGEILVPNLTEEGESSESVFTWMASARYHVTDDAILYARVATGYRPGGPNAFLPGVPPQTSADTLTNYEAGFKGRLFDRKLTLDLSAFYIDWKNIQLNVNIGGVNHLENAGDATSKGFELATVFTPVQDLHIGFNAAYTDAHMTELIAGAPPILLDYQLPYLPKWSGAFTVDYDFAVKGDWKASVGGGIRHVGRRYGGSVMAVGGSPAAILPSYEMVDLHANLSDGRYTFKLFVRNLTDKRAFLGSGISTFGGSNIPTGLDFHISQPRTVGIGMDVRF